MKTISSRFCIYKDEQTNRLIVCESNLSKEIESTKLAVVECGYSSFEDASVRMKEMEEAS